MISKIKISLIKFISVCCRIRLRIKGVTVNSTGWILNAPQVKMARGSQILIGNNVTLNSSKRFNPLTERPVILRTLTPTACIEFKDNSGISGSSIICANKITIGEYTIIGANTLIYDSDGHAYSQEKGWNTPRLMSGRPITIGKKCFIGTRCIILGGVTIGDSCVISAGTVLTQDVPSGHKAYGNPAIIEPLPVALGGPASITATNESNRNQNTVESAALNADEEAFLQDILNFLELSTPLTFDEEFREHEEWDSLAFLSLTSVLQDKYNFALTSENYNNFTTLRSLYKALKH